MASLSRSLLALAVVALLQVACAHAPVKVLGPIGFGRPGDWGGGGSHSQRRRHCVSHMFGDRSVRHDMQYDLAPIHLYRQVNDVVLHDPNRKEGDVGTVIIGEEISVCTIRGVRAKVTLTRPDSFDYVRVESTPIIGPTHITMYVTRYLERS